MSVALNTAAAASALLSAPVLRSVMREGLASKSANSAIAHLVESGIGAGAPTVRTLIWRCDRWLSRHYRNDLVYRRAVLSQMFHRSDAVILPEFRVGRSIVDFMVVAESLHAVEIKSDLDNTSRLERQIRDYRSVAPLVSIISSKPVVERLRSYSDFQTVGLHWFDSNGHMQTVRDPKYNYEFLNPEVMVRSLRRGEYLGVLSALGFNVPELPNTRVFSYALELARGCDPCVFHRAVSAQLKERKLRAGRTLIARLPEPLRPAVLKLDPTRQDISSLLDWVNEEVVNVYA